MSNNSENQLVSAIQFVGDQIMQLNDSDKGIRGAIGQLSEVTDSLRLEVKRLRTLIDPTSEDAPGLLHVEITNERHDITVVDCCTVNTSNADA